MDILIVVLTSIMMLVGCIGAILPMLPGVSLCYAAILLVHFTGYYHFSTQFLIFWFVVVAIIHLLDYLLPVWGAKKFGGSKWGIWGSCIGIFVGAFFAPWGILLGPLLGALIGELLVGKAMHHALKASLGAFIGLFFGIITKIVACSFLLYHYVRIFFSA